MKYLSLEGLTHLKLLISNALSRKVDKETGKGLSTNDYTTEEKNKLAGLENYTLPTASADTLGGVKVGAGLDIKNGVLSATGGGTADAVDWENVINKPTKVSEFTNDTGYLTSIPSEYVTDTELSSKDYQTKTQVNEIVKNVVGSAPEALDTLKELADALGNDANFASTITGELSKKANSSDLVAITNSEIDTIWES